MRFVAAAAGPAVAVILRLHLREPLRLGGVRQVAHETGLLRVGTRGLGDRRVRGVGGERAVACLAAHPLVLATFPGVHDVRMALLAGGPPRENRGAGPVVRERPRAVGAQGAEARRDEQGPEHEEDQDPGAEQRRRAQEMAAILETAVHRSLVASARRGLNDPRCPEGRILTDGGRSVKGTPRPAPPRPC